MYLRLLAAVVAVRDDEHDDGEHGEERLHSDEVGGQVVVDFGFDGARVVVVLAVLELRVPAAGVLGKHLNGVFGRRSVDGELGGVGPVAVLVGHIGARFEELRELRGLPALLVLRDDVHELPPRPLGDLSLGEAKLDVHGFADGETGVGDGDVARAAGVLGLWWGDGGTSNVRSGRVRGMDATGAKGATDFDASGWICDWGTDVPGKRRRPGPR